MSGFFDQTIFGKSARTKNRYNERYKKIILHNMAHIRDKKILDLASHNGVWSWAALKSGANTTLGIEGRQELIDEGVEAFSEFENNQYRFICEDIFDGLNELLREPQYIGLFDTVFVLGIFYHIMDHYRLLSLIARLKPKAIIIDTPLINDTENLLIHIKSEETKSVLNAIPEYPEQQVRLVGFPTIAAFHAMVQGIGYSVDCIDWRKDEIENLTGLEDYFSISKLGGKRLTFLLTSKK